MQMFVAAFHSDVGFKFNRFGVIYKIVFVVSLQITVMKYIFMVNNSLHEFN